jgi:hypothetical protein
MDGLVIESKDGKELLKGGRISKLVERLAYYKYPGKETFEGMQWPLVNTLKQ